MQSATNTSATRVMAGKNNMIPSNRMVFTQGSSNTVDQS